jgi:vesicle-fusing ATPase
MAENGLLDSDVNIDELAALTKNYSGAEITGVIKAASSHALNRHIKVGTFATVSEDVDEMKLTRDDFLNALAEVKPSFGVSYEELENVIEDGIIPYSPKIEVGVDKANI